jgi:hypothetical protein
MSCPNCCDQPRTKFVLLSLGGAGLWLFIAYATYLAGMYDSIELAFAMLLMVTVWVAWAVAFAWCLVQSVRLGEWPRACKDRDTWHANVVLILALYAVSCVASFFISSTMGLSKEERIAFTHLAGVAVALPIIAAGLCIQWLIWCLMSLCREKPDPYVTVEGPAVEVPMTAV